MRRRTLLASVAVFGVAACSDPSAETATDTDVTWPDPTAKLDGVKLTIWAAQNSNRVPDKVVAGFTQATGARVEVVTIPDPYEQGIQTKVATGDKPDLAFWQPTASMLTAVNARTHLQPLTDAPWLPAMAPDLRDITGLLNGTRYAALVTSPAVEGVYYHRDHVRTVPKNFGEMVDLARSLKARGVTPFHEMAADRWATQWWVQVQLADAAKDGFWERVNTAKAKFTDPVVVDAIKRYKGLIDEGLFNPDIRTAKFEDQGAALLDGRAAMVVQVNSFFGQLQAKADTATLDRKIGFFPIAPSGNVGTFIPDQSNALVAFRTGDTSREAAARQLLAYWLGPAYKDFVADRNTVSLQPAVADPPGVPKALLDVHAALPTSVGSMQALAVANPDLYINLADMITGTMSPEQVAKATQDQFEQLARAAGAPGFLMATSVLERRVAVMDPPRAIARHTHPMWFLAPAFAILFVFFLVPTVFNFVYAFTDWSSFKSSIQPVGLANFGDLASNGTLFRALRITVVYAVLVAVFQNLFGFGLAVLLERDTWLNRLARVLFLVPVLMSALAVGYVFQALLRPDGGLNRIAGVEYAWLADPTWTIVVVAVIHAWKWMGLSMLIYLAGLKTVPEELVEAARIDGASRRRTFWTIRVPLLAPAVTFNVATALLGSMNGFDIVQATTGGGPARTTEILNIFIYRTFGQGLFAQATTMSLVLFLLVALLAFPVIYLLRRRERVL